MLTRLRERVQAVLAHMMTNPTEWNVRSIGDDFGGLDVSGDWIGSTVGDFEDITRTLVAYVEAFPPWVARALLDAAEERDALQARVEQAERERDNVDRDYREHTAALAQRVAFWQARVRALERALGAIVTAVLIGAGKMSLRWRRP
jgi:hypothetical protein